MEDFQLDDALTNPEQADYAYMARSTLVVEGKEDERVISILFEHSKHHEIDILPAVNTSCGEGCKAVIRAVQESEDNVGPFWGIVDRDALFSEKMYDVWWEFDDVKFFSQKPFGDRIKVLNRWELENYLLEPKIIADLHMIKSKSDDGYGENVTFTVADELLDLASWAKVIFAANLFFQEINDSLVIGGQHFDQPRKLHILHERLRNHGDSNGWTYASMLDFCSSEIGRYATAIQNEIVNNDNVDELVSNFVIRAANNPKAVLEEKIGKMNEFFCDDPSPVRRWHSILRVLDGKQMLKKIKDKYKIQEDSQSLAYLIKLHNCIDEQLSAFWENIVRAN